MAEGAPPRRRRMSRSPAGSGLRGVAAVWSAVAALTLAIVVTYARFPPEELYSVSGHGLAGGASRALVFLGFPVALIAIAVLGLAADRLLASGFAGPRRRAVTGTALVAFALCATVVWPGVVDQGDLDAKPVNALAAVGVAFALGLTIAAARAPGGEPSPAAHAGDSARVVIAAVALVVALPWIAADLGFALGGVGIHPGHHHGMDGVLLVLSALLLSRELGRVRVDWLRTTLTAYLSLMLVYGVANIANDAWDEQVVERGWSDVELPNVLRPSFSPAWGGILAGSALVFLVVRRVVR